MKNIVLVALLCAAQMAFAQSEADGRTDARPSEDELFGTPQKTLPPEKPGTPAEGTVPAGGQQSAAPPDTGTTPQRPSEDELFGTSGGQTPGPGGTTNVRANQSGVSGAGTEPPAASAAQQVRQGDLQEEQGLAGATADRFSSGEAVENPLQIGALYYQRAVATNRAGNGLRTSSLSAPTLVDAYFDGRPNDRLRAMVVGRLTYDPTFDEQSLTSQLRGQRRNNPDIVLDQLWLRFDIMRTVFVTAGRQHVKWGTARFWNPTDYLHSVRRDALALFDERVGTNMIKFHLPVESNGANFYAIGLLDNPGHAGTLGQIGAAGRSEWVIGNTEIGADAVVQDGHHPRYGLDLSTAVGPMDIYAEGSLRRGTVYRFEKNTATPGPDFQPFTKNAVSDFGYSVAGGVNWTFAYRENDTATVGAEYFYNPAGYDDPDLYPALLLNNAFQPFYTGQHYAALYAVAPGPFEWDNASISLSNLANLSDRSFVTRLDYTIRVLTHLTVEANASVFYGNPKGEFRLRLDVPPLHVDGKDIPAFTVPEQRFSFGMGLRLDI